MLCLPNGRATYADYPTAFCLPFYTLSCRSIGLGLLLVAIRFKIRLQLQRPSCLITEHKQQSRDDINVKCCYLGREGLGRTYTCSSSCQSRINWIVLLRDRNKSISVGLMKIVVMLLFLLSYYAIPLFRGIQACLATTLVAGLTPP
ncbi:hypothetical protein F5Y07DRAFT_383293 [Xylaria sp. FL0933]|nr:hypothetical protein F5Y07DRAFT_383293 [Xylaria sp. FL0933]